MLKKILNLLEIIFHMKQDQYIIIKKKTKKGIYGNASTKEIKELKEEGIETEMIPWIEENEN